MEIKGKIRKSFFGKNIVIAEMPTKLELSFLQRIFLGLNKDGSVPNEIWLPATSFQPNDEVLIKIEKIKNKEETHGK